MARDGIEKHSDYNRDFFGEGSDRPQNGIRQSEPVGKNAPFDILPPFQEVIFLIRVS